MFSLLLKELIFLFLFAYKIATNYKKEDIQKTDKLWKEDRDYDNNQNHILNNFISRNSKVARMRVIDGSPFLTIFIENMSIRTKTSDAKLQNNYDFWIASQP